MTIWRMRIACCITKATGTYSLSLSPSLSQNVILINFSTTAIFARKRLSGKFTRVLSVLFIILISYKTLCSQVYDMIYLLTAIGLSPGGSSTVHIYTQTIYRTIQNKQYVEQHNNFGRVRAVPRLG